MKLRGSVTDSSEQFFIFSDGSPVSDYHARDIMKLIISRLGLNPTMYGMHSYRIGRTSDLINKFHLDLELVKRIGHWRSSAIYKYIRD